jgi:hypothetical protein
MTKKRDYKKEYRDYHGTPEQKKRRAQRNAARRKLGLKKGDPREAGHVGKNRKGPLGSKVRAISKKTNQKDKPKRDGSDD